ncbi:hypothetical protein BJF93_15665 [Xaviernesmea oryzae]|uniref:Phosphatidic acid phosphatase type 2/haloperoxidase domain-containing protein n=1 Tax=Xaviernesmea oryzae TaxID=464029 RepID=A0A1Q9AY74_9HYPH|nr:lipid A 1-phosphatase LpxE [Xaviernesmea oryzae]OLP60381.1 hypothetical protein BJF93_15665 [Xaviernesmea oryzae]SEK20700.1 Membrane-associated phospholipid phosphatase [Xaviernesmea oryzae]
MHAFCTSLAKRWCRRPSPAPCLHWKPCLFITLNIVLLAAVLFDRPLGAGTLPEGTRRLGNFFSGFGDSSWSIIGALVVVMQGRAAYCLLARSRARAAALRVSWLGVYLLASVTISGLIANFLKRAIGRARPSLFDTHGAAFFEPFAGRAAFESFPSGHATTIGALCMAGALIFPRARLFFAAAAVWLGMTRVMVGAHYPSDVSAGLILGGWCALAIALGFARCGLVFKLSAAGQPLFQQPVAPQCPLQSETREPGIVTTPGPGATAGWMTGIHPLDDRPAAQAAGRLALIRSR